MIIGEDNDNKKKIGAPQGPFMGLKKTKNPHN
jgi:hypothetical protein